jgi:hypothetical protein
MSQLVEDFKAGKLDLVTLDWSKVSKEDQETIMGLIINGPDYDPNAPIPPVVPVKTTKPKNRGLGNTIKYVVIAGLVIGAGVIVYTLAF